MEIIKMREVYTINAWEINEPTLPDYSHQTKSQKAATTEAERLADSGKYQWVEVTFFRESDQQSGAINRYTGADFETRNWVEK